MGEFVFDDGCGYWETIVEATGFDAFRYDWGKKETDSGYTPPNGRYKLQIDDYGGNADRPAAAALALKVLGNQSALVRAVTHAMWEDINGRGPHSGMWWHGDFDLPVGACTGQRHSWMVDVLAADGIAVQSPDDLLRVMGFRAFLVRDNVRDYQAQLIELDFDAAFEMEHGVGLLTDGERILGTGYQVDVDLFR
ncbi:MAG TPA: hypothetical protein VFC46_18005 [Humisphaera sp.]|nr:hypothetical protein [Humisphaera sp.]